MTIARTFAAPAGFSEFWLLEALPEGSHDPVLPESFWTDSEGNPILDDEENPILAGQLHRTRDYDIREDGCIKYVTMYWQGVFAGDVDDTTTYPGTVDDTILTCSRTWRTAEVPNAIISGMDLVQLNPREDITGHLRLHYSTQENVIEYTSAAHEKEPGKRGAVQIDSASQAQLDGYIHITDVDPARALPDSKRYGGTYDLNGETSVWTAGTHYKLRLANTGFSQRSVSGSNPQNTTQRFRVREVWTVLLEAKPDS